MVFFSNRLHSEKITYLISNDLKTWIVHLGTGSFKCVRDGCHMFIYRYFFCFIDLIVLPNWYGKIKPRNIHNVFVNISINILLPSAISISKIKWWEFTLDLKNILCFMICFKYLFGCTLWIRVSSQRSI